MQYLEVSGAVRPIYVSLGVKRLSDDMKRLCQVTTPSFVHSSHTTTNGHSKAACVILH